MARKLRVEEGAGGEIAKEIHKELDSSARAKAPCSVHVVINGGRNNGATRAAIEAVVIPKWAGRWLYLPRCNASRRGKQPDRREEREKKDW